MCRLVQNAKTRKICRRLQDLVVSASWAKEDVGGFTFVELLAVVVIVGVVGALLLPSIAGAKAGTQSTACRNRLRQIGLALTMYASEAHHYPSIVVAQTMPITARTLTQNRMWVDALYPYYPVSWTNNSWHCPAYIARGGIIIPQPPMLTIFNSYAYNSSGIAGEGWEGRQKYLPQLALGLGRAPGVDAAEGEVLAPSEMYSVADARWWVYHHNAESGIAGNWNMSAWKYAYHVNHPPYEVVHSETALPHGQGYNMLFVDGHVAMVRRSDYLFPPRTAHNWNRDNDPHPEAWAPPGLWVGQN